MRWLLVVAAFIVVPLVELWAILTVGRAIGLVPTILILLADSVLGALLLRSQGRGAWLRFLEALRSGRIPSREVADGLLIVVGAALLLTHGFLTDLVGLAFLLPPTRALLRRALERGVARRMSARLADAAAGGGPIRWHVGTERPRDRSASRQFDVEGTAVEHPPGPPPDRPGLER